MEWATTAENRQPAGKIGQHRIQLQWIILLVPFGALWYMLISQLSLHWAVNPQYSFGWFVPVICAYLFLIRWRTRPLAGSPNSVVARWIFSTIGLAILPTWLVEQANPDWRLVSWLLAFEVVGLSLCGIYFIGGRPWLRHFVFSVCFILVSVPWLDAVEQFVIQLLTHAATMLTVVALKLSHIPAVQHGNLIEVKAGFIGVDQACSGIRSFQATLMVSLFLGELYRASSLRRLVLVLSALLTAFIYNVGRTFLLAVIAARNGIYAISNWHDPLGFTIFAVCLLSTWGLARLIAGRLPKLPPANVSTTNPFPWRSAVALGAWVLLTVVGTELWYRAHETEEKLHWSFAWPVHKKDFSDVGISKREADILAFDKGRGATWENNDGSHWLAFFLTWAEGPSHSRILARMHRPELCLPANGYKLREDRGTITVVAQNLLIPFHALDFEYGGDRVSVFFCIWENCSKTPDRPRIRNKGDRLTRLESVLLGQRNLGQQILEIIVYGYDTPEEAEAAFCRDVGVMIQT